MGNRKSAPARPAPAPPAPPVKLTRVPWRQPSDWNAELEHALLTKIEQLKPEKKPNLLMIGPVGAGKSSFINSILSIGKGRKCTLAQTGDAGVSSWTLDLNSYAAGSLLKRYRIFDSMGIEPTNGHGFHVEDLMFLMKGHIKRGYTFNPSCPVTESSQYYRSNPRFEHNMHCVIFVVSGKTINSGIPAEYVQKIKELQDKIRREHIPRVLILTKVDEVCDEVERDITKLFSSVKIREAVKTASEVFGIEPASIHPIKNYEVDSNIGTKTNIPLLLALKQIMEYAADRVEYILQEDSDND